MSRSQPRFSFLQASVKIGSVLKKSFFLNYVYVFSSFSLQLTHELTCARTPPLKYAFILTLFSPIRSLDHSLFRISRTIDHYNYSLTRTYYLHFSLSLIHSLAHAHTHKHTHVHTRTHIQGTYRYTLTHPHPHNA